MKKLLLTLVFLTVASIAQAQTGNVIVQWDANPATDSVTGYILQLDSQTAITISPITACSGNVTCTFTFTGVNNGPHTITVSAQNDWATGLPTSVTFNSSGPGKVTNVRVKKG